MDPVMGGANECQGTAIPLNPGDDRPSIRRAGWSRLRRRAVTFGVAVAVGPWLALAGVGCKPVDACAETGNICGGDPAGQWTEVESCQDPALQDMAIAKRTYRGQPIVSTGQAPPEPTSTDWCADLAYGAAGISFLNLPRNPPRLLGAYIVLQGTDQAHTTGTYGALVTSSDRTSIEFSKTCLTRLGYAPDCDRFGADFASFGTGLGGVKETSCTPTPEQGCLCAYTVEADAAGSNLSGKWVRREGAEGNIMTFYASNMVLPSQVDYCVQGDRMTMWGHNRASIMDMAGVRTLVLERVVCGNGKVERGEQCDPPDQTTCSAACQKLGP